MNNKTKVIKRMAYGFRNEAYFFLKIRAAFPGIAGWTFFVSATVKSRAADLYPGVR